MIITNIGFKIKNLEIIANTLKKYRLVRAAKKLDD